MDVAQHQDGGRWSSDQAKQLEPTDMLNSSCGVIHKWPNMIIKNPLPLFVTFCYNALEPIKYDDVTNFSPLFFIWPPMAAGRVAYSEEVHCYLNYQLEGARESAYVCQVKWFKHYYPCNYYYNNTYNYYYAYKYNYTYYYYYYIYK